MPTYRLHDTTGDDLGTVEHPAPNLEPGEVVVLADGREAVVVARVEEYGVGPLAGLLEVAVAPTPLTSGEPRREDDELPANGLTSAEPATNEQPTVNFTAKRGADEKPLLETVLDLSAFLVLLLVVAIIATTIRRDTPLAELAGLDVLTLLLGIPFLIWRYRVYTARKRRRGVR